MLDDLSDSGVDVTCIDQQKAHFQYETILKVGCEGWVELRRSCCSGCTAGRNCSPSPWLPVPFG